MAQADTKFSEGEKNAVLCFSFSFRIHLAIVHAAPRALAIAFPSFLETDPQILGHWDCADEPHLGKLLQAMVFSLEF